MRRAPAAANALPGGGGPSTAEFEQPMSRPKTFTATTPSERLFYGAERTYTRQRLYRRDEADFDPNMHAEPIEKVRAGIVQKLSELDEDPYMEAGYIGVDEMPANIEQFRSDLLNPHFLHRVRTNRAVPELLFGGEDRVVTTDDEPTNAIIASIRELRLAREREGRTRSEIIRAMERAHTQRSLFTVDYARCVPDMYVQEFLSGLEANTVCAALVPMLYVRSDSCRYHMEEGQLRRVLFSVGTHFEHGEYVLLPGHMRAHVPLPPAENSWYDDDTLESEHAHYNEDDDTTEMRVLTFQIPTAAADADGRILLEQSDAAGYRVKVVCHLVERAADREELNVVCFRTFHFSRYN